MDITEGIDFERLDDIKDSEIKKKHIEKKLEEFIH